MGSLASVLTGVVRPSTWADRGALTLGSRNVRVIDIDLHPGGQAYQYKARAAFLARPYA